MTSVRIKPKKLSGEVMVPPSKSISHRAIICASLSEEKSIIKNFMFSKDMEATISGMRALGARIEENTSVEGVRELHIAGSYTRNNNVTIDCIESGSTLRFLIPISIINGSKTVFTGRGRLVSRPLEPYFKIFKQLGVHYSLSQDKLPLTIEGKLRSGDYEVDGKVSSQFISGLMFALPLLTEQSRIIITTDMESKGYVDLTIDMLQNFGVSIENKNYKEFVIPGNQVYKGSEVSIEGDYSQAAFWLVAGIIGERIKCTGMKDGSLQGDRIIVDIIRNMGGNLKIEDNAVEAECSKTSSIVVDVAQCPDLVPILAVLGTFSKGTMEIINGARVRIKESDRLKAISSELNKLGADIKETKDGLIINGVSTLTGGEVESWNDHRIAMALAVAATRAKGDVVINDSEAVTKSYPGFWEDFKALGGVVNEQ